MIVSYPPARSRGHANAARHAAGTVYPSLDALLAAVRSCRACEAHLPLGPRPVLRAGETASILVVGQAPGVRVHRTGLPWDDPSGERLRVWMGVDRDVFYDESRIAIIPMADSAIRGEARVEICRRAVNVRRYGLTNSWLGCPGLN